MNKKHDLYMRFYGVFKKADIYCLMEKIVHSLFSYSKNLHVIAVLPLALALFHGVIKYDFPLWLNKSAVIEDAKEQYSVIAIGHPLKDQYDHIIVSAAQKYDIDPFLIKAVIQVESQFNPRAVSRYGAKGLMQLMPVTAKILDVEDVFNAKDNVIGGTRHIKGLLNRYKTIESALGFYYAGTRYTRDPDISRAYISKVMKIYAEFRRAHTDST